MNTFISVKKNQELFGFKRNFYHRSSKEEDKCLNATSKSIIMHLSVAKKRRVVLSRFRNLNMTVILVTEALAHELSVFFMGGGREKREWYGP